MTTKICLAVTGTLSDDPQQQAAEHLRIATAWAALVGALKDMPMEQSIAIAPAVERLVRRRRGRPRLAAVGSNPPDTAA